MQEQEQEPAQGWVWEQASGQEALERERVPEPGQALEQGLAKVPELVLVRG